VQIPNGKQHVLVLLVQITALFAPSLNPPIKCGTKKREGTKGHLIVLLVEPLVLQIGLI
jgi:hypothetical protein